MSEIACASCNRRLPDVCAIACLDGKDRCALCAMEPSVEPKAQAQNDTYGGPYRDALAWIPKAQAQTPTWTCGLCKARFASELAMQSHVCETPSFQLHHENLQLRARVKELERSIKLVVRQDETEAANVALAKDLARKRDECERLESLIGDVRRQNLRISAERDDARAALASSATELAKLRRELRGKR